MSDPSTSAHGRLDVEIARARGIKSPNAFGLSKLIAVVECCDARFRTRSRRCRSNPDWNAHGYVEFARAPAADERVRVSVWDARARGAVECRGSGTLALASEAIGSEEWIDLELSGVGGGCGTVRMRATWTRGLSGEETSAAARAVEAVTEAEAEAVTETEAAVVTETEAETEAEAEVETMSEDDRMVVLTEMTPVKMEDSDANVRVNGSDTMMHKSLSNEDTEDAREAEDEVLEEEEEEDEWVTALRPSRKTERDSGSAVAGEDEKENSKPVEPDARMSQIWAEDSMEDIVIVSPPPQTSHRRAEEPVPAVSDDSQAEVQDLHEVRHVLSPKKHVEKSLEVPAVEVPAVSDDSKAEVQDNHEVRHVLSPKKHVEKSLEAEEARKLAAMLEAEAAHHRAPGSPERPLRAAIKSPSSTVRQSDDVETKSPMTMTTPGRANNSRVTFEEQANKIPTSNGKVLFESRTPPISQISPITKQLVFDQPRSPSNGASTYSMPTKSEIDEARRLSTIQERAEAVFASWSW